MKIQTATPSGTVRTGWGFLLLFCKAFLFCCHGTDSACSHGRSDATEKKGQCCANRGGQLKKSVRLLHLVSVDHLLDHHTADRTSLSCSQIAVIALLQVYANFVGRFYLKPFHCFFALLCEFALHIKNTFLILECCSSRFSAGLCAAFPSQ